jgi:hypothetical protein
VDWRCTLAIASTSPEIEGFLAQSELFAVLPLGLAAHATWRERWFSSGILSGLATVIKPIGVSGMLLSAGWWLYRRRGVSAASRLIAGYAVVGSLTVIGIWLIDWPAFLAQQELKFETIVAGPAINRFLGQRSARYPSGLVWVPSEPLACGPHSIATYVRLDCGGRRRAYLGC